ncbi:MAG: peptidoglycan-associated lipoprotein Pal [Halothiobacillus sp.]|jgi:peptidoglycan-associated lipoprotein|uniref:peptidoglycan-associated lipoprotein Pal n=1 Tax=Halothiobacillus sp. TaxID=1891311 RepID=UPI002AD3D1CE|nr:peptidoglycan-associated lipoprotein Pal [Halothiobacillus sp.]MDA3876046.1 peptidoglycan-associated lipoprotein Pal [Halothiobacillus sp.]
MRALTVASLGILALSLAACSSTPTKPVGAEGSAAANPGADTSGMNGSDMNEAMLYSAAPKGAAATVYFGFDKYSVDSSYRPMLQQNAAFLKENAKRHVLVEGNTDNRGSREYNIALGEKRATAVRDILMADGVTPSQVDVVSYGEERPAVEGNTEAAWAKNRRADLAYGK